MMKIVMTLMWGTTYVLCGIYLDDNKILTHPAFWACYGAFFAIILNRIIGDY